MDVPVLNFAPYVATKPHQFVFQSYEKTLTDNEIIPYMDAVYAAAKAQNWEVR